MKNRELMTRAGRVAASTPLGAELLEFLKSPQTLEKLKGAAQRGTPPAAVVSGELLARFPTIIGDAAAKRRVGLFIAAVLDAEGFSLAQSNVRIKDPLFTTGAVYRKRAEEGAGAADLESRLVSTLTEHEAQRMMRALLARFPKLNRMV
jgi:hypothetical protein